jgi:peptide/nickel transport system permease protein
MKPESAQSEDGVHMAPDENRELAPRNRLQREPRPPRSRSHADLMWLRFRRHRVAMAAGAVLIVMYFVAVFCEFFAPFTPTTRWTQYIHAPPQAVRFVDVEGRVYLRPFVYPIMQELDPDTWERIYVPDLAERKHFRLLVRGAPYKLWGLFPSDIHLFGIDGGAPFFLLGSDSRGRDLLTRTIYGARISLSVGLVGITLSLVIGLVLGGTSGYFGGVVDNAIQRLIETLIAIPHIPLWMGLSAALPANWHPLRIYFGITLILSLLGWTSVARVVRGKFLQLKGEEFVTAAHALGASRRRVIFLHMIPNFMSYVIVAVTLAIPGMILAETSLSFLGLGLRAPVVSWGVLLHDASNFRTVAMYPWIMFPGAFVVIAVLAFNFLGDGLRDAADPYSGRH